MRKFTVVLSVPNYVAQGETYLAHVKASTPDHAVLTAQSEAFAAWHCDPTSDIPDNFAALYIFPGHLTTIQTTGE